MRGKLAFTIGLLLLPLIACAARWSPYVGGALPYDVAFAHYHLQSLTESGTLHDFGCWGSQFEAGLTSARFSIYGAYHFAVSSAYVRENAVYLTGTFPEHQVESQVEENSWKEKRGILGVRWHIAGAGDYPVKPLVGFALTYGKSRLRWTETRLEYPDRHFISSQDLSRASHLDIGEMVEFGMLIETRWNVAFSVLAQVHRFEAEFPGADAYIPANHYVVLMPGWLLGMRYVIPSLHIGQ